jgi:hypothetical protein
VQQLSTEDGRTHIQCRFDGETLWLTQAQMAGGSRGHEVSGGMPAPPSIAHMLGILVQLTISRGLFRGRTDVYPIRFENQTGKADTRRPARSSSSEASLSQRPGAHL